eukprot:gene14130-30084_t
MGITSSNKSDGDNVVADESLYERLKSFLVGSSIPIEISVAHFTPAIFPLIPVISVKTTNLCRDSWAKILQKDFTDENGTVTSGMTLFYNDFYERLEQFDGEKNFESVLTKYSKGSNKIAAKGLILIKIIKYVLKIEEASPILEIMLQKLGKAHDKMKIRPWQYATYIQTVLLTLADRLDADATHSVMEAWVNLFAYVMKFMLPNAIRNVVKKGECHFDTSTNEANERIQGVLGCHGGISTARNSSNELSAARYPPESISSKSISLSPRTNTSGKMTATVKRQSSTTVGRSLSFKIASEVAATPVKTSFRIAGGGGVATPFSGLPLTNITEEMNEDVLAMGTIKPKPSSNPSPVVSGKFSMAVCPDTTIPSTHHHTVVEGLYLEPNTGFAFNSQLNKQLSHKQLYDALYTEVYEHNNND